MIESKKATNDLSFCQPKAEINMIKIVLCDDDPIFLESTCAKIKSLVRGNPWNAVVSMFEDAMDIPEHLLAEGDIFFLDIDFSEKGYTGLDIAKQIRQLRQDSIIIFLTNYIEYAPDGYEVQAFRYLLKSTAEQKLEKHLREAIDKLSEGRETIQISISGIPTTLCLEHILYVESQGHLAIIHTQKPGSANDPIKEYKVYSSLTNMEQQLANRGFLRIQKSYLVNMRRIIKYRCSEVTLDNNATLPASEKLYAEQKKQYLLWKGLE